MEFYILILFSQFRTGLRERYLPGTVVEAHVFNVVATRSDGELYRMEAMIMRRLADTTDGGFSLKETAKAARKTTTLLPSFVLEEADVVSLFQFDYEIGRIQSVDLKNRADILVPETVREALSKFAPIYGGILDER